MGLTRPRASQIYNLDYKQAVRAVATTNVTLAGGAPSVVDGVNLAINDRVLCTGQTTGSQNLIYVVTTVGTGTSGTWTAAYDDNTTGELDAGTIVMVTEGSIYADTQWKLITDNPILIGTTALTWTQNYLANAIVAGTSNVSVQSNANVTISSGGTANVLTISSTGTVIKGTESVTGNITAGNILTNGYYYANGTAFGGGSGTPGGANTQIQYNNAGSFGGSAAFTFNNTTNTIATTGTFSATANITGGNILTNGLINVTNTTANTITTTLTSGADANFNLTAQNGVAQNLTNTEVARFGINHGPSNTGWDSFTQYIRGSASQNGYQTLWASNTQIATINSSGLLVAGVTSATGNITGGNILTGGLMSSTGNATHGNVFTAGVVSATGNVTGNYILGNGSLLTGVSTSSSNINNGTSNVTIASSGGNITMGVGGTANVVQVATTGEYVTGIISATGNIIGGGVRTTTASTPPSSPSVGDVWYNTTNTVLYRYSYDGTSYYWQDLSGGGIAPGSTGNLVVATLTTPVYCPFAAVNTLNVLTTTGSNVAVYTS
jgi:hypothetical protein